MKSDEDFITAYREADDKEALRVLAARYMDFAKQKAKRFTSSPLEYDDIVQEAMLGFISALNAYDINGGASFKTFVSRCMDHRIISVINKLKSKKRIPGEAIIGIEDIPNESSGSEGDPQELLIQREKADVIYAFINSELTESEKKVLSLFLGGLKYSEIATKLNVTAKSVDGTMQRIRRKLREPSEAP